MQQTYKKGKNQNKKLTGRTAGTLLRSYILHARKFSFPIMRVGRIRQIFNRWSIFRTIITPLGCIIVRNEFLFGHCISFLLQKKLFDLERRLVRERERESERYVYRERNQFHYCQNAVNWPTDIRIWFDTNVHYCWNSTSIVVRVRIITRNHRPIQ